MTEAQLNVWERALGWRKRQMIYKQLDPDYNYERDMRNRTLEEVAKEFEKMPFGDTSASFARYVRDMKR